MPSAKLPIPNTSNTVLRSIVTSVVTDLKNNLGVDNSAFVNLSNILDDVNSVSGLNVALDNNAYENPIIERIDAQVNLNKISDINVTDRNNPSKIIFFKNKHLELGTEYSNYELSIDLTYHTKSKTNIDKLITWLKNHYLYSNDGFMHKLDFYTIIPNSLLGLIEDVYTTAKINYDDGVAFLEYLKTANVINAIRISSDVNGVSGDKGLVVIGSMIDIHGQFDTELKEVKSEFDKDNYDWSTTLTYKLNYMGPEIYHIDFSTMVNNTLISDYYYINRLAQNSVESVKKGLWDEGYYIENRSRKYVAIPPYDNHKPNLIDYRFSYPLCSIMCMISNTDKKNLFSLDNLIYYELTDKVSSYMKSNYDGLVSTRGRFDSLFFLELYKDDELQDSSNINVDINLNVSGKVDLDIRCTYRVVLNILLDLNLLTTKGRNSLIGIDLADFNTVINGLGGRYNTGGGGLGIKYTIPISTFERKTSQVSIIQTLLKKKG